MDKHDMSAVIAAIAAGLCQSSGDYIISRIVTKRHINGSPAADVLAATARPEYRGWRCVRYRATVRFDDRGEPALTVTGVELLGLYPSRADAERAANQAVGVD